MNTQGFLPFTNLIRHGYRVTSQFINPRSGKRNRHPIVLTIGGAGSDQNKALSIGEAREMMRALEAALFRADQYRGLIDPHEAEQSMQDDRDAVRATFVVVK